MNSVAEKIYTRSGKRIALSGKRVFNLGCGRQQYEGVVGVDISRDSGADVICNLDKTPWPIEDSSADILLAFHVLEHLDNLNAVMEEAFRVLVPGGRMVIEVPYFRSTGAFQDPTHKHFFTSRTIDYFCSNKKRKTARYSDITFRRVDFWLGWPAPSRNILVRWFKKWIKEHQDFYDTFVSIFLPVKVLVVEVEAIK